MQSASWTATVVYLTQLLLVRSLLHDTEKCSLGKSRLPLSACHALYAILYMPFPDLCDYKEPTFWPSWRLQWLQHDRRYLS